MVPGAGGRDTLVASASDAWTDFDLGLGEEVANIGGAMGVSVEELLAAAPDLVLASTNIPSNQEMLPALEAAGVDVAFFSVDTFEDYLRMLEICTTLTGCPENYQTYGEAVAEEIEAARARAAAEYCAKTLGWARIECTRHLPGGGKAMLSIPDVHARILETLCDIL